MRKLFYLLAWAVLAISCSTLNGSPGEAGPAVGRSASSPKPARLVVAIVYDQFPSWVYSQFRDFLSPEGALRRSSDEGADHVVQFAYAGTSTAAGHAAIFTGVAPAENGVGSNRVWSAERGMRSVVDGGIYAVFGVEDAFASPNVLQVDSVGDALRKTYGDRTKIVGLSYKDRGAVLTTGRSPDLALWYDKRLGAITSSTYYGETLAGWVSEWIAQNPITRYFVDWRPLDPKLLERLLGPDEAPGEGDYLGFGKTFPHNPIGTSDPKRSFRLMPHSTFHLLGLARESVTQLELGADDVPDLLILSLSSMDYTGHTFGPDSWEYLDHLIRLDTAVGEFLVELERMTTVGVLITSDHGVARLPERWTKTEPGAGRIFPDSLPARLNTVVSEELGEGEWVAAYAHPFVYLTEAALETTRRGRAVAATIAALHELPEVALAFDMRTDPRELDDASPVDLAVANAIPRPRVGDVFVVPSRGSVVDEGMPTGAGTSHGSPWPYDRLVPVVFSGPGIQRVGSTSPMDQSRVASTLCKMLGVDPPSTISGVRPLPGI